MIGNVKRADLWCFIWVMLAAPMMLWAGAPAASDTTFTYQGFLEQSGAPYNGAADFKVSGWDDPITGVQVTSEQEVLGLNVNGGVFVLPIDFGANWLNGETRWLKISVRAPSGAGGYTDLTPRESIAVAPYAIQTRGLYVKDEKKAGLFTQFPQATFEVLRAANTTSPTLRLISYNQLSLATWMDFYFSSINAYNSFGDNSISINDISTGEVNIGAGGGKVTIGGGSGDVLLATGSGNVKVGDPNPTNFMKFGVKGTMGAYSDNASLSVFPGDNYVRVHFNGVGSGGRRMEFASNSRILFFGDLGINNESPLHPIHVGTTSTTGNGAHLTGGGMWVNGSDANSKQNFEPISGRELLEKVAALPVTRWRYKGEGEGVRHIGPMAQDFKAAFGLGESEKHIGTVDADGVALAAIQGLNEIVKEQAAQIAELKARLEQMENAQIFR